MFWTGQKDPWSIYLGPIIYEAHMLRLAILLAIPLFPAKGVHGANKTGSNESQCHLHVPAINSLAVTLTKIS